MLFLVYTDGENLLLGGLVRAVQINEGVTVTVPCRTTHPNATVTFVRLAGQHSEHPQRPVTYDPQRGFTIRAPTRFYDKEFNCNANYNGILKQLLVLLLFRPRTSECCLTIQLLVI
jgi:hypothetical protein